ncbi:MAG: glycogen synthase [Verrucomicrobiae bacterium]|nr:glycogen synthase [Verrucomicrobiae bacterium]
MKALFLTKEYPPHIYGGAGVHVDYLTRELAQLIPLEVRCFGTQQEERKNLSVHGFGAGTPEMKCASGLKSALDAARRGIDFNGAGIDADLVHCHTWYTHLGGMLAKLMYGIPLVITVHSLEPLRPWKREQLGGGYDYSLWVEKNALEMADAIIAVSMETKKDILSSFAISEKKISVIHNGIDLEEYVVKKEDAVLKKYGIDADQPCILFVGRITRQKGIMHLLRAIKHLDSHFQIVLCADAPDTPEIALEIEQAIEEVQARRPGIIWVRGMLPRKEMRALYSGASLFVCPSIYEPFGIINLEAMACGLPVVASAVGGIREVVVDGVTGFLVPLEQQQQSPFEPCDSEQFSLDLAARINQLMGDPVLRDEMGRSGRERVEHYFSWKSIAEKTARLYAELVR